MLKGEEEKKEAVLGCWRNKSPHLFLCGDLESLPVPAQCQPWSLHIMDT